MTTVETRPSTAHDIYVAGGITVTRLGENIGALIEGVHVSGDIPAETAYAIRYALAANKVVVFRGQHHVTDDIQYRFAGTLGSQTTTHPTLTSEDNRTLVIEGSANTGTPTSASSTGSEGIDPASGRHPALRWRHTWASTTAAYEQLPAPLKALVDSLWAVHSNEYDYAGVHADRKGIAVNRHETMQNFTRLKFEIEHPVVRVHPETGERSLLLGHFVKNFVDSRPTSRLHCSSSCRSASFGSRTRCAGPGRRAIW